MGSFLARMSRCSSRHKSTNRPVSLSRHHGTSNGYLSLKSKYSQRYNLANGADDAHHHHRRTRRHRSRDCKQSCHHQSSRRSSSGSQRNYRRRYRHITSPHDENTTTNAAKRSKLSSSARRQLSYSTSIATRSPPINSKLSPTHVRKLHSTNPLPSSASTSVRVSPATCKQEVAITTLTAARPATKSSLSLSPPMVQSPPSPTSSFGASFFGKQHARGLFVALALIPNSCFNIYVRLIRRVVIRLFFQTNIYWLLYCQINATAKDHIVKHRLLIRNILNIITLCWNFW